MKCKMCETFVQDRVNGTIYNVPTYSWSGDEAGVETRALCWKCQARMEQEAIDESPKLD